MNMKPVAKPLGLFLRAGVYQVRVMIPQALQPTYGGRTKVVRNLGTSDRKKAERHVSSARLQLMPEFEAKTRGLNPQPPVVFVRWQCTFLWRTAGVSETIHMQCR